MEIDYRAMVLECLRENATNMRVEHEDLGRRISIALEKSRESLACIENMNMELRKMKETVLSSLGNLNSLPDSELEIKSTVRRLLNRLSATVADYSLDYEFSPEIIEILLGEPGQGVLDEQDNPDSVEEPAAEEKDSDQPATEQ